MFDRSELKSAAKSQIQGNIGMIFLITLIISLITSVASFAAWLVAPAFTMSLYMIYLKMIDGQRPKVENAFDGFSLFGKALWLDIITGFFIIMWMMLLIIPGFVKAYAYSLAPYILAENPEMTAREALRESKRLTYGYKMSLFVLELSFFWWAMLGVITCGIAFIYVIPYMSATRANAYKKIVEESTN